jgi:hypothetical protein
MLVLNQFLITITFVHSINGVCVIRQAYNNNRVSKIVFKKISTGRQVEVSSLQTTEYRNKFCQENFGRRLNSTALSFSVFLSSKNVSTNHGSNPGQCCLLCFENINCDYYYQQDLSDEILLCSLFNFENTPFNFLNDVLFGKYYVRGLNGHVVNYRFDSIGFPNRFLNL